MIKNLYYLPYNIASGSIQQLKKAIGGLKIRKQGSQYSFSPNHLLVVWGHGDTPPWGSSILPSANILNHWSKLPYAINKLRAFKKFREAAVPTPDWTSSFSKAEEWITAGDVVFCRTKLSSMEGRGIVVAKKKSELVEAKLYTKLFPKDKEYRVHVFKGEVIDYVQKKLRNDAVDKPGRSRYIRNTENGWIFARQGVEISSAIRETAIKAVQALELDFGAVDLAVSKNNNIVVFEVNTAPGLEGTTISRYAEAITKYSQTLQ